MKTARARPQRSTAPGPDEYVKQNGAETYRAKLDSASGYFIGSAIAAHTLRY